MGYSSFDRAGRNQLEWDATQRIGTKRALKQKEVRAIRFWLDQKGHLRDRALLDIAFDSELTGSDLVHIEIGDLASGNDVRSRA